MKFHYVYVVYTVMHEGGDEHVNTRTLFYLGIHILCLYFKPSACLHVYCMVAPPVHPVYFYYEG